MPASLAARVTLAPLTGVTNSIPLPGFSGVRRASTISKLAPALASGSSLSATPPARSSMLTAQTSAFVALSVIASSSRKWPATDNLTPMWVPAIRPRNGACLAGCSTGTGYPTNPRNSGRSG
jgi:hypothetical protein